jgi:transcriptional regulator with XRE-family HTH domain
MPQTLAAPLIGTLIRERRQALSLRQGDLAERVGISPSYLNLIEHNRRRVGGDVLARIAAALDVALDSLTEGAKGALVDDLRAAVAASGMAGRQAELDRIEDFVGRFPGWAAVTAATQQRAGQLERAVAVLNDRLAHDPYLSASLHEVLSAVSSVRSTAGILAETEDIDPDWRARFHRNLHQDSERLASGAEALVAYLDGSERAGDMTLATPQEEVEQWLSARGWHLAELEEGNGPARIGAEVAALASAAARQVATALVEQLRHEALALPQARLAALVAQVGSDPGLIAQAAGVSVILVMRRMALQPGVPLGLLICDASGTPVFRKPVDGFSLPRFGAACPLWPLFAALGRPMMPVSAIVETADRTAGLFRAQAISEPRWPQGFAGPELREAAMLLTPIDVAPAGAEITPVGSSCRICPRDRCPARRDPSILTQAD